jgi:limonene-1,2-epoxide hydrolase
MLDSTVLPFNELKPVTKVQRLFANLNRDAVTLDNFATVYSEDIVFVDPAHEVHGLEQLVRYSQSMYDNVISCRFEFTGVVESEKSAVLTWNMVLQHPKLNKGATFEVPGCSHIEFDSKLITYHRDYFDLGSMIYERVPVLGMIIRKIKGGLGK